MQGMKLSSLIKTYSTPSGTSTDERYSFHHRGLECKSRKLRDTWNNRQIWPWSTEWSRAKATSFAKRTHWSQQTPSSKKTEDDSTHGHHQMATPEIRLIIFFVAKDGEALYSQQKQDWEQAVAQIMNFLSQISDWNLRKWGTLLDHSGMT